KLSSAAVLQHALDRLVSLFREAGIHAPDLAHPLHLVVVGAPRLAGLDLDRLLHRLRRHELLAGGAAALARTLGVVAHLSRDRLPTLVPLAEDAHGAVDVRLSQLLNVLEILDHGAIRVLRRTL